MKRMWLVLAGLAGTFMIEGALAQGEDIAVLFNELQQRGGSAEDVITGLLDEEFELNESAGFTVSNAGSIGLSIAYAQAAVCLAPDQPSAQVVGQVAVDSAPKEAANAVQAGVVTALSSYVAGTCREFLDQRNNGSQAFASGPGSDGGAPLGGGGAEQPPVSESQ